MKIVIVQFDEVGGWGIPAGVFDTMTEAQDFVRKIEEDDCLGYWQFVEVPENGVKYYDTDEWWDTHEY